MFGHTACSLALDAGPLPGFRRGSEVDMRTRPVVAAATFAAITLLTIGQVGHATASRRCALITFERATWVTDTLLVGTYLIEHDDVRMAIGEACTVLYRGAKGGEVVVSFHCIPH